MFRSQQPLTQSRILVVDKDMTIKQMRKKIFKLFRPIIQGQPMGEGRLNRNDPSFSEETVLNAEYKNFFETGAMEYDSENVGNQLYKLQIYNNTGTVPGILFTYRKKCEYCDREHKDHCDLQESDDNKKMSWLINQMGSGRDLILIVHWRSQP